MSRLTHRSLRCGIALLMAGSVSAAVAHEGHAPKANAEQLNAEAPFISENAAAMETMMAGMDNKPTGDIDRDFVAMMSAHHQGAIDMAVTMLKYGHNEQLKRMAQEIIVEQQQEIAAMRLAIGDPLPPSVASPTQTPLATKP
ncbi:MULTISPECIES: DUF305 domain-containing protein [unclassified Pseudomonas]|uniref:DUF305 domain-containing protein n=1 Tax=unclassified Pseudomonas TaxID=196821 RepID=UPI0015AE574B|nr:MULTISPECIES: DUF305 domain-containing protein [unclassified Pseudomonas]